MKMLIADDHAIVRRGVRDILTESLGKVSFGEASKPSEAIEKLQGEDWDVVVLDTAGRLHLDETLMEELVRIKGATHPDEILFVADAMTGQDAVRSATAFHEKLGITGVVLTKMDGTAKGGIALAVSHELNLPIKLIGTGEKLESLQPFDPLDFAAELFGDSLGRG